MFFRGEFRPHKTRTALPLSANDGRGSSRGTRLKSVPFLIVVSISAPKKLRTAISRLLECGKGASMTQFISDLAVWFPAALVGTTFTSLALIKVYGFSRGIVGGGCKPVSQRLCGTCPSWSRSVNIGMVAMFFVLGLGNLAYVAWIVSR